MFSSLKWNRKTFASDLSTGLTVALVAGEKLARLSTDADPVRALFTLTLLAGAIMFALGALKLVSVIRFVSREVMTGFVFAIALLIILGQYKDLVGYASTLDTSKLFKVVDIALHTGSWNVSAAVVGFAAIVVLVLFGRYAELIPMSGLAALRWPRRWSRAGAGEGCRS